MNKAELVRQIRFSFEQLKSDNGTSDFEHICRYFSRARIVKNVIPATGPVQSGGDQGRDFETFHSYISSLGISSNCSVAFSNAPIVFACSLEKNPLKKNGKIDKDVQEILKGSIVPERIYFFSGEDIPVGQRHKKENEVNANFGVELSIIDAQGLSEHLSDPDLFWIANQYLKIPNEFFPRLSGDNWYSNLYSSYENKELQLSFQEFADIKSALRHIYKDEDLKVDLNYWFNKLEPFITGTVFRSLKRNAIYEKFVAKLIGQNDINGLEGNIRDYFSDFNDYNDPSSIEDAQILLSFVKNSKKVIGNNISNSEIEEYEKQLDQIILEQLELTESKNKKCHYIEIQARIISFKVGQNRNKNLIKSYVSKLEEMLPDLKYAPLYPLEKLSNDLLNYITIYLEIGYPTDLIEEFAEKIDLLLAERYGSYKIGESTRNRVRQYINNGKIQVAIDLLHKVKVKWFSNETMRGLILTSLQLSDCYSILKLDYAAKYYSMIAADMSILNKDKEDIFELIPESLLKTANSCYNTGSWINYIDLLAITINSFHNFEKDFNIYSDQKRASLIFYPAMIKMIAEKFDIPIEQMLEEKFKNVTNYFSTEINDFLKEAQKENDERFEAKRIIDGLSNEINGIPFNDLGERRKIVFNAIGINWTIEFCNDYETNSVGEQFASMLQIFIAEFINEELFFIRSDVFINLETTSNKEPSFKKKESNIRSEWIAKLPFTENISLSDLQEYQNFYIVLITVIFRQFSLAKNQKFKSILDSKMNNGILEKVTFGNTYNNLYREFVLKQDFNESNRELFDNSNLSSQTTLKENPDLPWMSSLAENYSKENNITTVKKRLELVSPVSITLKKMKENPLFMSTVNELRKKWCDWHIYLAFVNNIINYKFHKIDLKVSDSDFRDKYQIYFYKEEKDWMIDIPMEVVSKENLLLYMETTCLLTVLPSYGLENHSQTPNFKAIEEVLTKRFNFLEDGRELTIF